MKATTPAPVARPAWLHYLAVEICRQLQEFTSAPVDDYTVKELEALIDSYIPKP